VFSSSPETFDASWEDSPTPLRAHSDSLASTRQKQGASHKVRQLASDGATSLGSGHQSGARNKQSPSPHHTRPAHSRSLSSRDTEADRSHSSSTPPDLLETDSTPRNKKAKLFAIST
jgi:hypothetical protein